MKIQLPLETWMAILDWILRFDLARKLDKLWDSQLTPIAQHWLHEYRRNVMMRPIEFRGAEGELTSQAQLRHWYFDKCLPIAQVEMPENIVAFSEIEVSYIDSKILSFMHQMRSINHNVNLQVSGRDENSVQTAVRHVLPLIEGPVDSIEISFLLLPFLSNNFPAVLSRTTLLKISAWSNDQPIHLLLANWLFSPYAIDGKSAPRMLILSEYSQEKYMQFFDIIKQRFVDPNRQASSPFIVRIDSKLDDDYGDSDNEEEEEAKLPVKRSVTENVGTGEQLLVRRVNNRYTNTFWLVQLKCEYHERVVQRQVLITNCSLGVDPEVLSQEEQELLGWNEAKERKICLCHTQIGPINDTVVGQQMINGNWRNFEMNN